MPKLDPAAPMASLRALSRLTMTEAAEARRVAVPTQHKAEHGGAGVRLETLLAAADALGFTLEIVARPKKKP
jgi:DNA mismatch repair protein MutH